MYKTQKYDIFQVRPGVIRITLIPLLFLILLSFQAYGLDMAALNLERAPIAYLTEIPIPGLIGFRIEGDEAVVVNQRGQIWRASLSTGNLQAEQPLPTPILDFDLNEGKVIALSQTGEVIGATRPNWPRGPFPAYLLEFENTDLFLTGEQDSLFFFQNATEPARVADVQIGIPLEDGFLWALRRHSKSGLWTAELVDMFGNQMKRVYRFSREFSPSGVTLGPKGPEGELLVSYWNDKKRELALIGQNSRMLWKINIPSPVCRRNLGWDQKGNLIILEDDGNGLVLQRLQFLIPEG